LVVLPARSGILAAGLGWTAGRGACAVAAAWLAGAAGLGAAAATAEGAAAAVAAAAGLDGASGAGVTATLAPVGGALGSTGLFSSAIAYPITLSASIAASRTFRLRSC